MGKIVNKIFILIIVLGIISIFYFTIDKTNFHQININDNLIKVELAVTLSEQQIGLSGRKYIPFGTGMLFIFEDVKIQNFWMKDTLVSLDIAWIRNNGSIAGITYNLTPESYFENPPINFSSPEPVRYVLETPAGYFASLGIKKGDRVIGL